MAEAYEEPEINDETAAQAEAEQQNEIVVIDDKDGSWKLELGDGFQKQWQEITTSLQSSMSEDNGKKSMHRRGSSIYNTVCILDGNVLIISLLGNTSSGKSFVSRHLLNASDSDALGDVPVCIDEATKKGATTANINCYLRRTMDNRKTLILDYEGEKGSAFPLLHFARRGLQRVLRTAEKAQQRRQAITDYFPKLAYILSNVVILIGNDDLASTDYLTRCREFAMKANDGVSQMVNLPMLIIVQNKGSLAQCQDHATITQKFFTIHGEEAAALRRYFSDIQCFCLPHRDQLQKVKGKVLDGEAMFNEQMVAMKEICASMDNLNSGRSLTHAQWLYLLQRVLPIVQSGKSISLHTLLSEIITSAGDKMIDWSRFFFIEAYETKSIHSSDWFQTCCRFAVRAMAFFLTVKNSDRRELMSDRVIAEQCGHALQALSEQLEDFQPCQAVYTGKGHSSKNMDDEHPVYCYQHKGAHKNGHRTCESVYGLSPWKEFFGWISSDVWPGEFIASNTNKFGDTIFPESVYEEMLTLTKDLTNTLRQDRMNIVGKLIKLLKKQDIARPRWLLRRICFCSSTSSQTQAVPNAFDRIEGPYPAHTFVRTGFLQRRLLSNLLVNRLECSTCYQRFNEELRRQDTQPIDESKRSVECAICFDGERDFIFVPCGHRGFCGKCADQILDVTGSCPFCRAPVSGKQRVHDV